MIRKFNLSSSIYYTLSNAVIDTDQLNNVRLKTILRKKIFTGQKVNLVIDDTSRLKHAKGLLFNHMYIGNLGKVDEACNMVTISFAQGKLLEPVEFKFYLPSKNLELGKSDPKFKTKIEISRDLINYAESVLQNNGKDIGVISFDSFYGSSENLNLLNNDKYTYFSGIRSNRKLKYIKGENLSCFVTAVKSKISPVSKGYFKAWSSIVEIKDIYHPVKLFIIKTSEKDRLYISNDLSISDLEAIDLHLERSYIDVKEYKELKTETHLMDCRYLKPEGYIRHVRFVHLCFDILRGLHIKIFGDPYFNTKSFIHHLSSA